MSKRDEEYMRLAIATAREGIAAGQMPFGAAAVVGGEVVAVAHNTVWRDVDPTAHAEMNAIRWAAKACGDIRLPGTLYSTCEPCAMCLAAIHWSGFERVVYGALIADAVSAGFSELHVQARTLARLGGSALRVDSGVLEAECRALFDLWKTGSLPKPY